MGSMTRFSLLDLVPVREGDSIATALANTAALAAHAEKLGYHRFWVAEHHGMAGIASAATSVVLAHIGQATSTIRIGAGGIMLPCSSPNNLARSTRCFLVGLTWGWAAHRDPTSGSRRRCAARLSVGQIIFRAT